MSRYDHLRGTPTTALDWTAPQAGRVVGASGSTLTVELDAMPGRTFSARYRAAPMTTTGGADSHTHYGHAIPAAGAPVLVLRAADGSLYALLF